MLPSEPIVTSPEKVQDICEALSQGQCVALPTETVYGLAADATNGQAVARIFELKNRPSFNPLICHVDGIEMARRHGQLSPLAERLAKAFWPGPLTIVVPLAESSGIHPLVSAELGTIGLRCPRGPARNIIAAFGNPLAAPSANLSGNVSPTRAEHVAAEFPNNGLMIVDGGPSEVGLESTIVKVEEGKIIILRPGSVTPSDIMAACGIEPTLPQSGKIEAPGMMQSHYAPNAKLLMNCNGGHDEVAWLLFADKGNSDGSVNMNLSPSGDLREAAANLYHFIKKLDATGAKLICAAPIPEQGLGIAINDRLRRAAAPRTTQ